MKMMAILEAMAIKQELNLTARKSPEAFSLWVHEIRKKTEDFEIKLNIYLTSQKDLHGKYSKPS